MLRIIYLCLFALLFPASSGATPVKESATPVKAHAAKAKVKTKKAAAKTTPARKMAAHRSPAPAPTNEAVPPPASAPITEAPPAPPPAAARSSAPAPTSPQAATAEDWCTAIGKRLGSVPPAVCRNLGLQAATIVSGRGHALMSRDIVPPTRKIAQAGKAPAQARRILLIGGIHGDELTSASIVFRWL